MFSLAKKIIDIDLNEQLNFNKEKIIALKKILYKKNFFDIKNDYSIFKSMNEVLFDYTRRYPKYEKDHLVKHAHGVLAKIIKNLYIDTLHSYCDIGCGWGHFPRAAFELGASKSLGIDLSSRPAWESYTHETDGKLIFKNADITDNNFDFGRYQLVTTFAAFEHFSLPMEMLTSMAKLVADNGYLYIKFSPIYNSADGYHMYRYIHIPWYHLIFSNDACLAYYKEHQLEKKAQQNYFNQWSAFDFMSLFSSFSGLKLLSLTPLWNFGHLWFVHEFDDILPRYSSEELMISGFEVIYKKCNFEV